MKKLMLTATALMLFGAGTSIYALEAAAAAKAPAGAPAAAKPVNTIVDVATADSEFSTLVKAMNTAGWTKPLSGKGHYTIFAPTNDAFNNLPSGKLDDLMKPDHKIALRALLRHHVVGAQLTSAKLKDGTTNIKSIDGTMLSIKKNGGDITIDGAKVVKADISASNGEIFAIGTVLQPPAVTAANAKDTAVKKHPVTKTN